MDRRTYTFLVASAAFLFFYLSLRALVAPPQPAPVANQPAELEDDAPAQPEPPDGAEPESASENEDPANAVASTSGSTEWYTLGSMAPSDGYNMLITFRNRGAGIERIELTARDPNGRLSYRRIDTRSGYLGYFAGQLADNVDGVLVNVVGPGTPADLAVAKSGEVGLEVGDVILAVAGSPVTSESEINDALKETNPGQTVTVEVARGGAVDASASPLLFEAKLTEHPLDLVRLAEYGGDDQIKGNLSRLSCLMTLARAGRKSIDAASRWLPPVGDPAKQIWTANTQAEQSVANTIRFETTIGSDVMEKVGGQPVRLARTYRITPGTYLVDMDLELTNLGDAPQELAYRLEGPNGITAEGWWYSNKISPNLFEGAAARDVVYQTTSAGHELVSGMQLLKRAKKTPKDPDQGLFAEGGEAGTNELRYIGIDAQYFAVTYLPQEAEPYFQNIGRAAAELVADPEEVERHKERAVNVSFFVDSEVSDVPPGESLTQSLRLYAGPKEPELLEQYGLGNFIYYGWFSFFSRLLSGLLHFLQNIVGNYGVAIILLTVIVRGCMFPLSRNAAVNAQKMQELAPEMKKIAEKYKDDMEGRLKAQQALQKRVGFNPLAGCLPMFLQLPIFMGLYRALSVDIDLRQKPLVSANGWASNLAAPDQFLYWGDWWDYFTGRGSGWLGPYLNLLPIIVVVLFITQQKMFMPPATDEQTAMTQKVMTVMTLFMGLFFFRVPAGLCIYFIASSLWGIGERTLVKKTLPSGKHFDLSDDVIDAKATRKAGGGEKLTLTERLLQQVNQKEPEQPADRPNKRKRPPSKKKR
ncbi:membrane protein insertase YidC [Roseiconus nitratireducens]|uniref:Membrane protein insertase YidC n=1 Tax=Roseiconus nitratireducens TaxID=2605748 RepID=A0A5M6DJ43_9BACT|nr:membrane protein insertase YidC [Roseiconus nitratireducens]KAA5546229.1 membrane protein insertase YidC [Roseiconus nitratireducens]